jgi:uncharacterized membrane protein (GlpM family)
MKKLLGIVFLLPTFAMIAFTAFFAHKDPTVIAITHWGLYILISAFYLLIVTFLWLFLFNTFKKGFDLIFGDPKKDR